MRKSVQPADNLTLLCLVDGEATPFSVRMPYSETVDGLKKEIKHQKAPRFDDIAADELTLWCVSIPVADDNDEDDYNRLTHSSQQYTQERQEKTQGGNVKGL
ncbi:hypothetical protein BG000_007897 [Podila horticola]|nr:hypothetical protein BG000_007897 [Podila horticola]